MGPRASASGVRPSLSGGGAGTGSGAASQAQVQQQAIELASAQARLAELEGEVSELMGRLAEAAAASAAAEERVEELRGRAEGAEEAGARAAEHTATLQAQVDKLQVEKGAGRGLGLSLLALLAWHFDKGPMPVGHEALPQVATAEAWLKLQIHGVLHALHPRPTRSCLTPPPLPAGPRERPCRRARRSRG